MRHNNARLPRARCDLCGAQVVWVEKEDGKRIPIDPERVVGVDGEFRRGNTDPDKGPVNVVRSIREPERWLHPWLYVAHNRTCEAMKRCRNVGAYSYAECKKYLGSATPMTQSAREDREPERYRIDRNA